MFWTKNEDPRPCGVNLDELMIALSATTLKVNQKGNSLVVKHTKLRTIVQVDKPGNIESEDESIKAIVTIKTYLPKEIFSLLPTPESTVAMNAMVTTGALTVEKGKLFIGSRLTIYEKEDAWRSLHFPLLLFATIGNAESLLGAMRIVFTDSEPEVITPLKSDSDWIDEDLYQVERNLSTICVCTAEHQGLTAEFGLRDGEVSAANGDHRTALWQLRTDEPHPIMGGGLFCLLQMPHQIDDESKLNRIIILLNQMEMELHDLPPHFGAWCVGRMGGNLAYNSFLSNSFHSVNGIALHFSIWANARAQWANAMLASIGVSA